MKRILLFSIALIGFTQSLSAQTTPLANGDFESWQRSSSNRYDEPTGGIWATPNPSLDAGIGTTAAPVEKETNLANVQNGSLAAKLTTRSIFGVKAAGSLYTGKFVFNLVNPVSSAKLGVPFTARPTAFRGWFKYTPVNGDSCLVYARLTRKNPITNQREQVGIARQMTKTAVANYTYFDLPINYNSSATPDSIIVVMISSGGGENLNAPQVGSTLWVDNVSLYYAPTATEMSLERMVAVQTFPNPATTTLNLRLSDAQKTETRFQLFSLDGRLAQTEKLTAGQAEHSVDVAALPKGSYLYSIVAPDGVTIAAGKVELQ
jgi:Putative carbohydrate metabolism domain/Secretion system C-terminal sorting domain